MIRAEPRQTRMFVRNPAARLLFSRSSPIAPPKITARARRNVSSVQSICQGLNPIPPSFIFICIACFCIKGSQRFLRHPGTSCATNRRSCDACAAIFVRQVDLAIFQTTEQGRQVLVFMRPVKMSKDAESFAPIFIIFSVLI